MNHENRIQLSLFLLRLGVFIVLFIWTVDKFVRPDHAAKVYKTFYFIGDLGPVVFYVIGAVEMVILLGFLLGMYKQWTYGAVLVLHAISTLSSYKQYLAPFEGPNLLFFTAWPMLAACFALYYLRDLDNQWTIGKP